MMRLEGQSVKIMDAPGTYSLQPSNKAEEVTVNLLEDADIVINVVDSTNLERNLYLTLELLEKGKPFIVALNLWDETKRLGIKIDIKKLEEILGTTVVPTVALTGEGIKELVSKIKEAKVTRISPLNEEERWIKIGKIVKETEVIEHRHHTFKERLSDMTIKPATGIPIAITIIALSFILVRFIGENLITYVFDPLFNVYYPIVADIGNMLGKGIIHDILIGTLIDGKIDYLQSMGILTTGLYVPFGAVLPYIVSFYLALSVFEDSGYLPRLATLVDNIFHKLGMHGHGTIPVFLGLGCNVPGALSARTLETCKQRFISTTLLAISVPCMAQTAMIFGILGPYGTKYIPIVFATLFTIFIGAGLILNKFVRGESPEIFLEIPPYRRPSARAVAKKTWMRVRWFLHDAIPWLFFGVLVVNILYAIHFLQWLGGIFLPVTEGWLGLPRESTTALLIGFLRKDLTVGMLLPLGMKTMQLVIASTILAVYFPCVATFAVMLKELDIKDLIKSMSIMVIMALTVGGAMRLILLGI
ncbi:MAG: ferrous iron transporter B [Candidatus Thermoplasmatota archaeon]|nr:ferrous iron transporter B [Candidatus Thermoplasmatota archaeon]